MSYHLRNSTSSSCFNPKEPRSDDSPALSNARVSSRVRKLLEGVSPLKVPTVPREPKPSKPKKSPARKKRKEEPVGDIEVIRRLAKLKSLPPISPRGRHFANGVRDGTFTYADVAGEGLSRFLKDGLPEYEVFFGETKASNIRYNIEALYRADSTEIREILFLSDEFEPVDKWSADEKSKVSKYPMAIRTSGVAMVKPIRQHVNARGKSETNSPTGLRKTKDDSPEVLWMREKMAAYSSASGGKSPISLPPLDMFDCKDATESESEGDYLPEDDPAPVMQLDSKDSDWPQSPDGWTTSSSQCSDFDSDDDDDWTSEDKLLSEMFPHARYRQM
ncbi:hypothetical protein INS49_003256 [Diaporthe citri]|uniref:uncharacterized protein n=1 Tax=Diaporthe citri TaxID=83186 RepID=UPI001C802B03|nr:uncharacterized protein INS49_003256 [Diaporthe citri]KAG6355295.1 hypothetical protein INS49_003256 [Diaporthe citri]